MNYNSWGKTTNSISQIVREIKAYKCINPSCDSDDFEDGRCRKCHYLNRPLVEKIDLLEKYIKLLEKEYFRNGVKQTYNFLDDLYSINNIKVVNRFLKKINYDKIRNNELEILVNKYNDNSLLNNEYRKLEQLLLTKSELNSKDLDLLTKMIFNNSISIELAKKYLLAFTKQKAKDMNLDLDNVGFKDLKEMYDALTMNKDIVFDNNFIDRVYETNDFDAMYKTIFHELAHLKLHNDFSKKIVNLYTYKFAYDEVIRKNNPDIYNIIPDIFKSEIVADMRAFSSLNRFKREYGINTDHKELRDKIIEQVESFNTNDIKLNRYIVKYHDLAFAALVNNPSLYDYYDGLHIEFKKIYNEDGTSYIVRRSKEEIQADIDIYNKMKKEVYEVRDTYGINNIGDLFEDSNANKALRSMGITYDSFIEQSNKNRVREDVINSYDSGDKVVSSNINRGFSSIPILSFVLFLVVLFGILFIVALLIR